MKACHTRPVPCHTRPAACRTRPVPCHTRPVPAVSISTLQVLIDGPAWGGPSIRDQEPDFADFGANPNRRSGARGPLRLHAEAARPKGPAALGMSRVSLERR